MKLRAAGCTAALLASVHVVEAITWDVTSTASILSTSKQLAYDMMVYYNGNLTGQTPGVLPEPYYWWETGAMFGAMVDYWYYTGDTSYNDVVSQALTFQASDDLDYMPPNQTKTEGNDDQGFWGLAAMSAAEANFPNPPVGEPQWLALAMGVFNTQARRWDNYTCGGGLRWQIYTFNTGYNYKNSISNGCFFQLGARLARYTNNETYAQWAETTWDWVESIGLLDSSYYVYDGSDDLLNCTQVNHIQWTYNAGIYLLGAASMYNYTNGSPVWKTRLDGLLNATAVFFVDGVMSEIACESNGLCNDDQKSFKAYLARWMAATTKLAPYTYDYVIGKLTSSAQAAMQACSGGDNKRTCSTTWTNGSTWDGTYGVGQQMSALEVVQSLLIQQSRVPVTNTTGGTSPGDYLAGTGTSSTVSTLTAIKATTGSRAAAGILTTLVLVAAVGGAWWMIS